MLISLSAVEIDEYPAKVKCSFLRLGEMTAIPLTPDGSTWRKCYKEYSKRFESESDLGVRLQKDRERDFSMFKMKVVAGVSVLYFSSPKFS
jgi:hypothetical protein